MPGTYESIASTTLGSAAASITFSSIPATFTDLRLVISGISTSTLSKRIKFNSDAGANYSVRKINGNGSYAASQSQQNESTGIRFASDQYADGASIPMLTTIDIFSYAGSTFKTLLASTSSDQNGTGYTQASVGLWRSTAAITSVAFVFAGATNYEIGTTAELIGIKNA